MENDYVTYQSHKSRLCVLLILCLSLASLEIVCLVMLLNEKTIIWSGHQDVSTKITFFFLTL